MILRDAQLADLPAITDIYNQAVRTTTATFDLIPVTPEARRPWFDSHNDPRYPLFVAEDEVKILGWACLSTLVPRAGYDNTAENSVYVDEAARGKGVGKLLLGETMKRAKEIGLHTIVTRIAQDNPVSLKLHQSFGFVQIGRMREVGYKFDRWVDVDWLQAML